jgi:ribonuclease P protein component
MTDAPRLRFRREQRLLHKADFDRVFATGRRVFARGLVLHALPSPTGQARIGLVTSRRFGDAVRRNRARLLRGRSGSTSRRRRRSTHRLPQRGGFPTGPTARAAPQEALARIARGGGRGRSS